MAIDRLNLYLPPKILAQMESGAGHRFFDTVRRTFESKGFAVDLMEDTEGARMASATLDAYAMFHFKDPFHGHAVDARPAYVGPFWKLEAETYRADFRTTSKVFDAGAIKRDVAARFFDRWQGKVCGGEQSASDYPNCVLVAMQGKLTQRRAGQSMSPIEMIETVLQHDPARMVVAKLHPKEVYSAAELAALDALCTHPRLVQVEGALEPLLAGCDYVVTMNSSVALKGLFFGKAGILFADCEYHHPFQSVNLKGDVARCFQKVLESPLPYKKYLFWYLQRHCINVSREFAPDRILEQCRDFGWQV